MSAQRCLHRLALSLAAGLLLSGCVAPTAETTTDPSQVAAPAGQTAPPGSANLEGCDKVGQQPRAAAESSQRLLDTELPCLATGPTVNPARLTGRPTVVNLWATWCEPCRQEMPMLQAVHRRYENRLQILGVNTKDRPDWASEFLRQAKVTYPQIVDREGQLMTSLRSPGLPVTVVLDAEGRITGKHVGRISEKQLNNLLPHL